MVIVAAPRTRERRPQRESRLLPGSLHIGGGVADQITVPEREDAVIQTLHDAPLRHVDLPIGPHLGAPGIAVVSRRLVAGILQELEGDDQRRQDDHFRVDAVNVQLVRKRGCGRQGVAFRPHARGVGAHQRADQPPVERELFRVERVKYAHGQGNRVDREVGAPKHVVNDGHGGAGQ